MLESCVNSCDPNNVYKDKCKHCWDYKNVRSFLTLIGSQKRSDDDTVGSKHVNNPIVNNPLKTQGRLLYLKTQSVPRCKHFSSRL